MSVIPAILLLACAASGHADDVGDPAAHSKEDAGTQSWIETSLDVVIKDKHGHSVRNLSPGDLQILEDGKPVRVTSLKAASGDLVGAKGDNGVLHFVSFLINGDSEVSRSLASEALTEVSKNHDSSNIYIAVWEVGDRFTLLHNFTNDFGSLRASLSARQSKSKSPPADVPTADQHAQAAVALAERTAKQILATAAQLIHQQHERPTLGALIALTRGQKPLVGRKMLLFFSDGMQLAAATDEAIKLIVSEANHSEVSFYTADISGVKLKATEEAERILVDNAHLGVSDTQMMHNVNIASALSKKKTAPGANAGQSCLRSLSEGTGGNYIDASNGVRKFVRGGLEDMETFYEASYQQPIEKADVHFRSIAVRVNRPGWKVQSRAGDFPSLLLGGKELSGFEIPLLGALSSSAKAETIWFSGAAVPTAEAGVPAGTDLTVQVPLSGLVAHELDQTKRFRFRMSILALLKDGNGQVVDKVSRDFALEGALESLTRARKDSYSFTSSFAAAPKGCRVDIAIRDEFASKISTKSIECSISRLNATVSDDRTGVNQHGPESDRGSSPFTETETSESEMESVTTLAPPKLLKNSSRPSDEQIQALIQGAKTRVLDYKETLPNFVCFMVTRRSVAPVGSDVWKPIDSSSSLLTYVGGEESAVLLDVNGHAASDASKASDEGAIVRGEFGGFMAMPFAEKANAKIDWEGEAELMGKRTQVFRFTVSRAHSTYLLQRSGGPGSFFAAYHAFLYIDADTLGVRRLSVIADDIPPESIIKECRLTVDYDYIPVGGNEFLLPVHASLVVRRHGRILNRNEIDFQNYRKYGAESKLVDHPARP